MKLIWHFFLSFLFSYVSQLNINGPDKILKSKFALFQKESLSLLAEISGNHINITSQNEWWENWIVFSTVCISSVDVCGYFEDRFWRFYQADRIFPVGPSRLLNDEIVNREIKEEPQWKQRRLREVTYHEQAEGLVPTKSTTNGDKQAFSARKAQVRNSN